jgi:putative membrane protein insertion efficiency factor
MAKGLILLIKVYRLLLSPWLGSHCRFYPSCSQYAMEALEKHGILQGGWLALKRLLRCHPWYAGGVDPVPEVNSCSTPMVSEQRESDAVLSRQHTKSYKEKAAANG